MSQSEKADRIERTQIEQILFLFIGIGLFCLVWGIFLQFGRYFEWSLFFTGNFATIAVVFVTIVYFKFYKIKYLKKVNTVSKIWLFPWKVFVLGILVGTYRFFHFSESSDSLQYLIGAAHHAANPELKLQFNMPGHLGENILNLYYLSQVPEYFLGYLSMISSLNLVTLYFHFMPAVITLLGVFSTYLLFLSVKSSAHQALLLTILSLLILFLNFGDGFFGEWAIRRTETTRSFFNAFVLNILLCTIFLNLRYKDILPWHAILIISTGFSFTSQTLPFLIFLSMILLWWALVIERVIVHRALIVPNNVTFFSMIIPALMIILISHYLTPEDIYTYQLEGWRIRELPNYLDNYYAHFRKVFGENGQSFFTFTICLALHTYFLIKFRASNISFSIYAYAILYTLIVINPISFTILSYLSAKHVVYFRFFYLFPVLLYPAILLAIYSDQVASKILKVLLILLLITLFTLTGSKNLISYTSKFQFKRAKIEQKPIISEKMIQGVKQEDIQRNTLLTFRQSSFRHGVFSPSLLLLVSKNQFLPLYRNLSEARILDAAQFSLGGSWKVKDIHIEGLSYILKKYMPNIVIARQSKSKFVVFEDTMKEAGYNLALEYENQMLFLRQRD